MYADLPNFIFSEDILKGWHVRLSDMGCGQDVECEQKSDGSRWFPSSDMLFAT